MKSSRPLSPRRRFWQWAGALLLHGITTVMASTHLIYLGTYTRNSTSKGIYAIRLDSSTGSLGPQELVMEATDPAWLALSPDRRFLYTIHGSAAQAIGFKIDAATA